MKSLTYNAGFLIAWEIVCQTSPKGVTAIVDDSNAVSHILRDFMLQYGRGWLQDLGSSTVTARKAQVQLQQNER